MFKRSSVASESTVTLIGTFKMLSSVFRAVTVISDSPPGAASKEAVGLEAVPEEVADWA
jgi:hypothetical protein